jgi:hypothetical protein
MILRMIASSEICGLNSKVLKNDSYRDGTLSKGRGKCKGVRIGTVDQVFLTLF